MKMIRILMLALLLCVLSICASCEGIPEGYTLVAESDRLMLLVQDDNEGIAVVDRISGEIWRSTVPEEHYASAARVNKTWKNHMSSMFQLYYTPTDKPTGNIKAAVSVKDERELSVEMIEHGVVFHYYFTELSIGMDLEITLDGDEMVARIPAASLKEDGGWGVTSISLLPFFMSSQDTDEGYYVYPNGSGELYRFKDQSLRSNALYTLTMPVYSGRVINNNNYPFDVSDPSVDTPVAMLPVYGAVRNGSGVSVVIEEGDADSAIVLAVGGVSVPINRIYPRLYYRADYGVLGQEIYAGGSQLFSFVSRLIDPDVRGADRVVRYTFLAGEDADYSGIACAARENLQASGVLTPMENAPDMVLDILMGVEHDRVVSTEYLALTTFEEAQEMVGTVAQYADDLVVNLKGWGKRGVLGYPHYFPASSKLGGTRGLKALADDCAEQDIPLLLQVNSVKLTESNGGFGTKKDTARDGNNFVFEIARHKETYYLSSASRLRSLRDKWLTESADLGASGMTWEDAGVFIYDDMVEEGLLRHTMADFWQELLAETKQLGMSAVEGGNAYVLPTADLLREIPEKSTLYYFGDESIPLYQMIVHGSVAYTGQPVNVFYDEKGQVLKMLEYGFTPCYELAARTDRELLETDYNMVFSLTFGTWTDSIQEIAAIFEQTEHLRTQVMLEHEKLAERVYAMHYEDGSIVCVNYGAKDADSAYGMIPAEGYLLVKGGESK